MARNKSKIITKQNLHFPFSLFQILLDASSSAMMTSDEFDSSGNDSFLSGGYSKQSFAFNISESPAYNFTSIATPNENNLVQKSQDNVFESGLIIPLYVAIFFLSVIGNSLVVITLAQNKRMRTVTNVYLLNLVSENLFYICFRL